MDVAQNQFWKQLLYILEQMANAKFITIDLEMSGIPTRSRYGPNPATYDNGKPSLQDLYSETRTAAKTYQILQVGITCVEEDREKEFYKVRPFNFNLSPLLYLENRIKDRFPERKITFSSGAAAFLQNQAGFDIGKVFKEGVYYLSVEDEEESRRRFQIRTEGEKSKAETTTKPVDNATLEFVRYARKIISDWATVNKEEFGFVNVGHPTGGDLNGYQRMLVHQLVQSDFPGYRSFPRGNQSFIQVERVNETKDAQFQAKKMNEFQDAVAIQIGLRWIFEALTGGNFEGFRTGLLANEYVNDPELSQTAVDEKFKAIKAKLQNKQHVLVGHNLFTDLVYVYKSFVGSLPKKVEDFQTRIHSIFPVVFDTKYIATEGHNSMSSDMRKNLEELYHIYATSHSTRVILDEKHTAYGGLGRLHEAGYDSYLTAHLFAKLTAKLFEDRKAMENFRDSDGGLSDRASLPCVTPEENYSTTSDDDGGAALNAQSSNGVAGGSKLQLINGKASHPLSEQNLSDAFLVKNTGGWATSSLSNLPSQWHADAMQRLGNPNPYALLSTDDGGDVSAVAEHAVVGHGQKWIPELSSRFWDIYVNKLRVNASEGGICDLAKGSDHA